MRDSIGLGSLVCLLVACSDGSSSTPAGQNPGSVPNVDAGQGDASPSTRDAADAQADVSGPVPDGSTGSGDAAVPPAPDAGAAETVPTGAPLLAYLQSGAYRAFAQEGVHPPAAPHGTAVKTYLNGALYESMRAGNTSHPAGSAAIKELFSDAQGNSLLGWAVMVKTRADSAQGAGWYWYEVVNTNGSNPYADGPGPNFCATCHESGRDYVRIPFPLVP